MRRQPPYSILKTLGLLRFLMHSYSKLRHNSLSHVLQPAGTRIPGYVAKYSRDSTIAVSSPKCPNFILASLKRTQEHVFYVLSYVLMICAIWILLVSMINTQSTIVQKHALNGISQQFLPQTQNSTDPRSVWCWALFILSLSVWHQNASCVMRCVCVCVLSAILLIVRHLIPASAR